MSIHPSILTWSSDRPLWQQDALRRLADHSRLTKEDLQEVVDICKSEYGATPSNAVTGRALKQDRNEEHSGQVAAVSLLQISNVENVNALKSEQALEIANAGVTVIFGDNAAGKSGYVRILKQLCRARGGRERIVSNVYLAETNSAKATLKYSVGDEIRTVVWTESGDRPDELAEVSIFDSRSAAVYVTEENDVAYLPHGMDLFPKLSAVIDTVRGMIEFDIASLKGKREKWESIHEGTAVFGVLDNLQLGIARERVAALATISPEDQKELERLRTLEKKFKSANPKALAQTLRLCSERIRQVLKRAGECELLLSDAEVKKAEQIIIDCVNAKKTAAAVRDKAFGDEAQRGLGEGSWLLLWDAARAFAVSDAKSRFPFGEGDLCLLCLQPVSGDASARMARFNEFVGNQIQLSAIQAADRLRIAKTTIEACKPESIADNTQIEEIGSYDGTAASLLQQAIVELSARRKGVLANIDRQSWSPVASSPPPLSAVLSILTERLVADATTYEAAEKPGERELVEQAIREFEDRKTLQTLRGRVEAQIQREEEISRLTQCLASATTAAVTRRNTELLTETVTEPLRLEFAEQVKALRLTHIPISLAATRGEKARALHTLELAKKNVQRVRTDKILSEGEHRCIALAAFFAEISLQTSNSTIVFDDPVSSLDHGRRRYVADRIVDIALSRPVVIFTHDLVFLWMIQGAAVDRDVDLTPRLFRRTPSVAGLVANEWPWDGIKVKPRIGVLKSQLVDLSKLADTDPESYDMAIRAFYGRMRDTWERAVEEVLFQGAIRRFGTAVRTQSIRHLHRVTEEDLQRLEKGMTKTSAWIQGHDHPPELNETVPAPQEAAEDLNDLEAWVGRINALYAQK